jgi:hypothetical protein
MLFLPTREGEDPKKEKVQGHSLAGRSRGTDVSREKANEQTGLKRVKSFVVSCWRLIERSLMRLAPDAIHFAEISTTSAELDYQQKI